jgi:potassium-transporting ATPase potassium-binding subunit
MTFNAMLQIGAFFIALLLLVKPLGLYMARVYTNQPTLLDRPLRPFERLLYRLSGTRHDEEMNWKTYALAVLVFNGIGIVVVYLLQRLQAILPLNPQSLAAVSPDSSFNTAISFGTNTNWQGYGGEVTMSYLTQMLGLAVQNFVSAATGMAVVVALIRGLARRSASTIGNFWVDMVRSALYILLPLALIFAVVLVWQGVPQTFDSYKAVPLVEASGEITQQTLALGPAASQIAIKQLGTNGGGFFNANAAHPFENPTPLTNFLQLLAILLIPAALCYTFGKMVGDTRQGWAVLAVMTIIFAALLFVAYFAEQNGNPAFASLNIDQAASDRQAGGNMEGKETRYGITNSVLWAVATTAASNGSVNAMHDSFTPIGGLIPMWNIQLGEIIFGGVGSGLYGILMYAIVTVFIAGLMVGRTPEYLGKKIEVYEMKMASLVILVPPVLILVGTAIAVMADAGRATVFNPGPRGFSEILYAVSSAAGNNGSAFAGLGANTPFYNTLLGIVMFFGRFWIIIPVLAVAGSLARKKTVPAGSGTLPTHNTLFIVMLIGVIIIVGALTFLPALALGPIVEHLIMIGV